MSMPIRLRRALGALAMLTATVAAVPAISAAPANAATGISVRLWEIQCLEKSDVGHGDRPYFVVFTGSPTNPDDNRTVLVDPGIITTDRPLPYYPKTLIASRVPSGSLTVTVMVEQDDDRDLTLDQIQKIGDAMRGDYQKYFLKPAGERAGLMRAALRSYVEGYLGWDDNDDILGDSYATVYQGKVTSSMSFTGDGGDYRIYYTS
ncbi:hypothetical protein IL992_37320 [Microbispora sp. NEAU-D428]|uniref:hypothetical protein n=1 Tax=Microbispora sitophila TaxID=2771537 RepID=UPI00186777EE|nr:hypothetical protein [Microbispora sitophila]MBE3014798.1 hypothetical protein [Microbispora sitophila]